MISDCSTDYTCFGHAENIKIHHKRDNMPLGGKTGKKLGVQIDIINTLSMSMVKIFSQLLLYHIMDDRYLSLSAS